MKTVQSPPAPQGPTVSLRHAHFTGRTLRAAFVVEQANSVTPVSLQLIGFNEQRSLALCAALTRLMAGDAIVMDGAEIAATALAIAAATPAEARH